MRPCDSLAPPDRPRLSILSLHASVGPTPPRQRGKSNTSLAPSFPSLHLSLSGTLTPHTSTPIPYLGSWKAQKASRSVPKTAHGDRGRARSRRRRRGCEVWPSSPARSPVDGDGDGPRGGGEGAVALLGRRRHRPPASPKSPRHRCKHPPPSSPSGWPGTPLPLPYRVLGFVAFVDSFLVRGELGVDSLGGALCGGGVRGGGRIGRVGTRGEVFCGMFARAGGWSSRFAFFWSYVPRPVWEFQGFMDWG